MSKAMGIHFRRPVEHDAGRRWDWWFSPDSVETSSEADGSISLWPSACSFPCAPRSNFTRIGVLLRRGKIRQQRHARSIRQRIHLPLH